ncbi:MAG: redoxin domain-containing protein [Chloroflexi bacterium]|nr:redoxin domain-containing protein [Chloroflexota bacterium]
METIIPFYLSYVALWVLVVFQSLILFGLVRMVTELQQTRAVAGMSEGQEAPKFSATSLSGASINSSDFVGRLTALLFVSPNCSACEEALTSIGYLRHKTNQGNVIVICESVREECTRLVEKYKLNVPVIADADSRISRLHKISSVPTAIIIDQNNRIKSYGQIKQPEELTEVFPKKEEAHLRVAG